MKKVHIGVVGFSRPQFAQEEARMALRRGIEEILARAGCAPREAALISGLTNMGVPKLAYELAVSLGMRTIGISAKRALRVGAGLFPVDEQRIVGKDFGDESQAFIDSIDYLLRVGGGPQSRREVEMFREKLAHDPTLLEIRLLEYEVASLGR